MEQSNQLEDIKLSIFNDNSKVLYITLIIIMGIIFLWIIIMMLTGEEPIKILAEINKLASQIKVATDIN